MSMKKKMHALNFSIFLFLTLIQYSNTYDALLSSISPCSESDPNFNTCFLKESRKFQATFMKGIPELGVPLMDPIILGDSEFSAGPGFTMKNKNSVLTGLSDGVIEDIKFDFRKKRLTMVFQSDIQANSSYEVIGSILNLPLNGKGHISTKIKKFRAKMIFSYTLPKDEQGTEFVKVKLSKKELMFGNVMFKMDGLLNKDLNDAMNNLLNDNWKEVMTEVGGPGIDVVISKLVEIINIFLSNIPHRVLIPE